MGSKDDDFFDDFMRYKLTTEGTDSSGSGSKKGGHSGNPCGTFFISIGAVALILIICEWMGCA